ncbi:MAG: NifB/NifX family molybdenum-iron cluster-binding protein [Desulfuromonadaceae bacterium]
MMIIAITAQGPDPDSLVDQRFGRAYWILFYDRDKDRWDAMENTASRNASQGAGILAAQQLADRRAEVLVTGMTGPKAFRALQAAGIQVLHGATGTAREALQAYRQGTLTEATAELATGLR